MAYPLTHTYASYKDTYQTDVVLTPVGDHPPIRATQITVTLSRVPDDGPRSGVHVRVKVKGERIVGDGKGGYTTVNTGSQEAFGLASDRTRYELCQAAILKTLERRDIGTDSVDGFAFLEPWDVHKQRVELGSTNLAGSVSHHLHYDSDRPDVEDERW